MSSIAFGSKYDRNLSKTQIAAAIRAEIKAAQKLPTSDVMHIPAGTKVSVVCRRGQSIDMTITAAPFRVLNPAHVLAWEVDAYTHRNVARYTFEAARVCAVLERIAAAYNFDGSDLQSDYFHVNFYANASVAHDLETSDRAAALADLGDLVADAEVSKATDRAMLERQIASVDASGEGLNARQHAVIRRLLAA